MQVRHPPPERRLSRQKQQYYGEKLVRVPAELTNQIKAVKIQIGSHHITSKQIQITSGQIRLLSDLPYITSHRCRFTSHDIGSSQVRIRSDHASHITPGQIHTKIILIRTSTSYQYFTSYRTRKYQIKYNTQYHTMATAGEPKTFSDKEACLRRNRSRTASVKGSPLAALVRSLRTVSDLSGS